jgi:hypothetical protein
MPMNPCGLAPKAQGETEKRAKYLRATAEALECFLTTGVTFISHDGKSIATVENGLPVDAKITKVELDAADPLSVILTVESEYFTDDAPLNVEFRRRPIANLMMPDGAEKES